MIDIEPIKERLKAAGYVAGLLQEYEFEDNTSDADSIIHELIDNTNALIAEVERLREQIDAVRAATANHPNPCSKHPEDDPVSCGWKSAYIDVVETLAC